MLGGAWAFTPSRSGICLVFGAGQLTCTNTAANAAGAQLQLYYGTGTAPNQGANVTGTASNDVNPGYNLTDLSVRSDTLYTTNMAMMILTKGTAYWIDYAYTITGNGGSSTVSITGTGPTVVEF